LAMRRQRRAVDLVRVALEDAQLLAGVAVPQAQRLVGAARQHALAIYRYADAPHRTCVAGETQFRVELVKDVLGAAAYFRVGAGRRLVERAERRVADLL